MLSFEMSNEAALGGAADERREFRRVTAPIYCRPAHRRLRRRKVVDVGLGGLRVYSDDRFDKGARFEIELFLPAGKSVTCLTEVVWIREFPNKDPAAFDIGLKFLEVPESGREALALLLKESPDAR